MTHAPVDPAIFYTKPLETWTFVELTDGLGNARAAELLGISPGNVRVLRNRGKANVDRMRQLHAAIAADEVELRKRLVTYYTGQQARRSAPTTQEPTA